MQRGALQRIVFWTGLLLYVASFFPGIFGYRLVAVKTHNPTTIGGYYEFTGFDCAKAALLGPWEEHGPRDVSDFSLLISGWINPLLVITVFLALWKKYPRATAILRIMILLMIPFCWVFFYYTESYPREGHFLWVIGMLLMLFSGKFRKDEALAR
jgi:hypothetical protein